MVNQRLEGSKLDQVGDWYEVSTDSSHPTTDPIDNVG